MDAGEDEKKKTIAKENMKNTISFSLLKKNMFRILFYRSACFAESS